MSFLKLPVHLSPELIYMTLSYLDKTHDFQTLAACTLVNRQWKRPSQDRLFSSICIHIGDRPEDADEDSMMIDGVAGGDRQYERLAELITILEQSPHLIGHTSCVSILLHPSTPGLMWDHFFPLVAKLVRISQHVHNFELGGFFDHPMLHESGVIDAVNQLLENTSLKRITFTRCDLTSIYALTSATKDNVRLPPTLGLTQIYDDEDENQAIVDSNWIWTLHNFKVLNTSFAVASRVLFAEPHSIKIFECLILDLVDDTELDKFLDLISYSLERLKVSIIKHQAKLRLEFPRTALNQVLADMSSFDALRHLSIQCAWGSTDGCNYESVYNIINTFSSSNRLESLEILSESFLGTTPLSLRMDTSDTEPLRHLDQLLSSEDRFPRLKMVQMLEGFQPYQGDFDEYVASLQWHMQRLISRGMLEFRHGIQTTLDF
ncbi:hypothetical protein ONZ45_g15187 [Pleurotus djamor]|nr:hypothetical protein ONZ45_g15187 [Pleurotus djamor]